MSQSTLNAGYWDHRYQHHETNWDIGSPATPLKAYFDQLTTRDIEILIPGCGNAYEAEYLLEKGFKRITLADISEVVTQSLRNKFEKSGKGAINIITANFFDLTGQFDLIIEQTFFCALDPSLRKAYVNKVFDLLKPGGKLVGVLFAREFASGPPFGGSRSEYTNLFQEKLSIIRLEPCYNSIIPRAGAELFFILSKPST